ncbi:hypothetical protein [Streptococcus thalassemiae]|uniref:hypothetical protein n=1 Tax=Streptococcus thalassemiae TaxID=2736608 RepID=UPI00158B7B3A|nr:hypothetical protein [Streptococcus thalassemiae]
MIDGFVSVASAVLVCSETAEACSASFSFSFTGVAGSADFSSFIFGCSANSDVVSLSDFDSETVPACVFS